MTTRQLANEPEGDTEPPHSIEPEQYLLGAILITAASRSSPALAIEHIVTADMADGQPLPPFIEDGCAWHLVRRADGRTLWRRIFLSSSSVSPVIDWRTTPGDQAEAP
jgi:hypothetical protein